VKKDERIATTSTKIEFSCERASERVVYLQCNGERRTGYRNLSVTMWILFYDARYYGLAAGP